MAGAACGSERGANPVWPFEDEPLSLAEIYPRAAYAIALAEELPASPRALAKTKLEARIRAADELAAAPWRSAGGVRILEEAPIRDDEDDFDACLTALALLRLRLEGRPLATRIDPIFEGAMLGV